MAAACSSANFSGSNSTKRRPAAVTQGTPTAPTPAPVEPTPPPPPAPPGPKPYGTPETPDIKDGGWAIDRAKDDIDSMLSRGRPTPGDTDIGTATPPPTDISIFSHTDGVLWLPCREPNKEAFDADFFGPKGTIVRVSGEFCPKKVLSGNVSITFIVDHSGSMEGAPNEGPNDQTMNGSCGRLKAAEKIVEKFSTMPDVTVRAGVIGFSNSARVQVEPTDLAKMKTSLTSAVFCGSDAKTALTNYGAALRAAKAQLSDSVATTQLIYFISDGSPTTGGVDPRSEGLAAARELRALPGITLYSLFVGYKTGGAVNPQEYLNQISGDASLVRVTSNAEELVKAVEGLDTPSIDIDRANITATIKIGDSAPQALAIEKLVKRADQINRFTWSTAAFELSGEPGTPMLNKVEVTAKTSFGDTLSTAANITFHQQN